MQRLGYRPAMVRLAALALCIGAHACAHAGGRADLALRCPLPDAEVYVDEVYLGRCALWGARALPLKPGFHTIEVRAAGRYPFYAEVDVKDGARSALEVGLREALD